MPLVEIEWFKGRDDATRVKTIDLVTKAVREGCECSPEAVTVISRMFIGRHGVGAANSSPNPFFQAFPSDFSSS